MLASPRLVLYLGYSRLSHFNSHDGCLCCHSFSPSDSPLRRYFINARSGASSSVLATPSHASHLVCVFKEQRKWGKDVLTLPNAAVALSKITFPPGLLLLSFASICGGSSMEEGGKLGQIHPSRRRGKHIRLRFVLIIHK
jgi:hypothetical protein